MLLATTREKPRSRGERVDVDGVARAGDRARAERQRVGLVARGREAREIAAQRRDVREKEMRDEHRLRRPEVRERRHQRVAGRRRPARRARRRPRATPRCSSGMRRRRYSRRSSDTCSLRERPGVQTAAGVAEPLDQQALDEAVHVLVGAARRTPDRPGRVLEDVGERRLDWSPPRRRQHAGLAPAPAPTRGCRSHRLRRDGDRSGTTSRTRRRPRRGRCRIGRTRE